jgi:hypothetical protein
MNPSKFSNTNNLTKENFSEISDIRPPFPPRITSQDLISDNPCSQTPNCFIIYRKELSKELKLKNLNYDRKKISKHASQLWNNESDHVRNFYRNIAAEAKSLKAEMIKSIKSLSQNSTDKTEAEFFAQNSTPYLQQRTASIEAKFFAQNSTPYLQQRTASIEAKFFAQNSTPLLQQRTASTSSSSDTFPDVIRSNIQSFDPSSIFDGNFLTPSPTLQQINSTLTFEQRLQNIEKFLSNMFPPFQMNSTLMTEQRLQNIESLLDVISMNSDLL